MPQPSQGVELIECRFFEAPPDPRRGTGGLDTVRSGSSYKVYLDQVNGFVVIDPVKPDGSSDGDSITIVPVNNIRGMKVKRTEVALLPAPAATEKPRKVG